MTGDCKIFYVYAYIREEADEYAEVGTPYYIGEGKCNRINEKHNRSTKLELPAFEYRIKIAEGLTKTEALDLEEHLIAKYGRICNGTGILENISPRGVSSLGWVPTDEQKRIMSERRKGKAAGAENPRSLPVVVVRQDLGGEGFAEDYYPSVNQAAIALGVAGSQINAVASGRERHVKGCRVYYLSDLEQGLRLCDELPRPTHVVAMSPGGRLFWVENLQGFCNDNGLNPSAARNCVLGTSRTCRRWQFWEEQDWALLCLAGAIQHVDVVLEDGRQKTIEAAARAFCLRDPAGNIHQGANLSQFCRERDLPVSAFSNMLTGLTDSSRGWTRGDEPSPKEVIYVMSPEGSRHLVEPTPTEFANSHGIDTSSFFKMLKGRLKQTRGWSRCSASAA